MDQLLLLINPAQETTSALMPFMLEKLAIAFSIIGMLAILAKARPGLYRP